MRRLVLLFSSVFPIFQCLFVSERACCVTSWSWLPLLSTEDNDVSGKTLTGSCARAPQRKDGIRTEEPSPCVLRGKVSWSHVFSPCMNRKSYRSCGQEFLIFNVLRLWSISLDFHSQVSNYSLLGSMRRLHSSLMLESQKSCWALNKHFSIWVLIVL